MQKKLSASSPTPEWLLAYFQGLGITAPPRMGGAMNLRHYLEHGYRGVSGEDRRSRIAIIQATQKRLVGKRVRMNMTGQIGTISYLTAISSEMMRDAFYTRGPEESAPACLRFMIVGEDGNGIGLKVRNFFTLLDT